MADSITITGPIRVVQTATNTYYDIEAAHFPLVVAGGSNLDSAQSWKDYIDARAGAGFTFIVSSNAATTPKDVKWTPQGGGAEITGTLEASAALKGIYLVYHNHSGKDSYDEYIACGTSTKFWEKLGNTDIDLSNYLQKGVIYSAAALNSGVHTHTVPVPTISHTDKKLSATATQGTVTPQTDNVLGEATTFNTTVTPTTTNIKATASGTTVGADGTAEVIKTLDVTKSHLAQTTVLGVTGTPTTASKAAAGTAKDIAKTGTAVTQVISWKSTDASVADVYGVADGISVLKDVSLTGITTFVKDAIKGASLATDNTSSYKFNTDAIKSATCAQSFNTDASKISSFSQGEFTPTVTNGVLSFSFTKPILSYAAAGTTQVNISTTAASSTGIKVSTTACDSGDKGTVGVSGTALGSTDKHYFSDIFKADNSITPAVANGTITPYTFTDVNVPVANATATTVATGALAASGGAEVVSAVGSASTATALTGVKVTAQPTIELSTGATAGTGVISVVTGITSASTSAVTSGTGSDIVAAMKSVTVGNPSVTIHAGTTGDVDVVESLTTNTTSATTSQHTGHTHDVKVNN